MNDKLLSMLSMARRANKTACGGFVVDEAVKKNKARLIIVACDASDNTKKKFSDMAKYKNIPVFEYSSKDEIARYTKKELVSVVAITDDSFAKAIITIKNKLEVL